MKEIIDITVEKLFLVIVRYCHSDIAAVVVLQNTIFMEGSDKYLLWIKWVGQKQV